MGFTIINRVSKDRLVIPKLVMPVGITGKASKNVSTWVPTS
jgi:hypothetical protein